MKNLGRVLSGVVFSILAVGVSVHAQDQGNGSGNNGGNTSGNPSNTQNANGGNGNGSQGSQPGAARGRRGGRGNGQANGGNGNQNNGGGNQNGSQGNGNGGNMPKMPADQCQAKMPEIKTRAEACLQKNAFNDRQSCFSSIHSDYNGFLDGGCDEAMVQTLHDDIAAKEKSLYPAQAAAIDSKSGGNQNGNQNGNQSGGNQKGGRGGRGGRGNQAGNGGGNNGGNGGNNGSGGMAMTPEQCQARIPQLTTDAQNCLKNSDFNGRKGCFDQLGNNLPPGFETCKAQSDPVKAQIQAQEKTMYPDQASAVDGNNNNNGGNNNNGNQANNGGNQKGGRGGRGNQAGQSGPGGNMNGGMNNGMNNGGNGSNGMTMTPEQCQAQIPQLTTNAQNCLKSKEYNARKACFDQLGNSLPQGFETCKAQSDPVKAQILAQEKSMYPDQPTALVDGNGGNQNGNQANNGGNQNGGNQKGGRGGRGGRGNQGGPGGPNGGPNNGGMSNWTPEKCQAEASNLPTQAQDCLKVSDFNARRGCFQTVGNSHPGDFMDACRAQIDPIKNQVMAQEKSLYPDQASAVDSGNGGGNQNGNQNGNQSGGNQKGGRGGRSGRGNQAGNGGGNNGGNGGNNGSGGMAMTPEQCQARIPQLTTDAQNCLKNSDFNGRKGCFDQLGNNLPPGFETCKAQSDPVKAQIQAQEKTMYPDQASAVDGNNNNNGRNNNNGNQANSGGNQKAGRGGRGGRGNQAGQGGPGGNMNGGMNNGMNNGGNGSNGMTMTPEQCQAKMPEIKSKATACLQKSAYNDRLRCLNSVHTDYNGFLDGGCSESLVQPIHDEIAAKEKSMYPDQASALDGGRGQNQAQSGGQNNQNGNGGNQGQGSGKRGGHQAGGPKGGTMKPDGAIDCGKLTSEIRGLAMKCINGAKNAKFDSRKKCFDGVGSKVERSGKSDSCKDPLQQLKSEMMTAEKQKFPDQDNAIQ